MWTEKEKKVFHEKYIMYPKNFRKVKSFLDFKSVGDCISFYYLNKHELDLKRGVRQASKRGRGYARSAEDRPPAAARRTTDNERRGAYDVIGGACRSRRVPPCLLLLCLRGVWTPRNVAERE